MKKNDTPSFQYSITPSFQYSNTPVFPSKLKNVLQRSKDYFIFFMLLHSKDKEQVCPKGKNKTGQNCALEFSLLLFL
jgi:hypothetical protein